MAKTHHLPRNRLPADSAELSHAVSAIGGQSLDFFNDTFARWLQNATAANTEVMRFLSERLNKDIQLFSRFAACKKPEEFVAVQSDAVNALIGDYARQGSTIFGLWTATNESLCPKFVE
ncbi:MAG: phasin family protein [Rudaea sp.]